VIGGASSSSFRSGAELAARTEQWQGTSIEDGIAAITKSAPAPSLPSRRNDASCASTAAASCGVSASLGGGGGGAAAATRRRREEPPTEAVAQITRASASGSALRRVQRFQATWRTLKAASKNASDAKELALVRPAWRSCGARRRAVSKIHWTHARSIVDANVDAKYATFVCLAVAKAASLAANACEASDSMSPPPRKPLVSLDI
jgi:hypothetical protein